MTPNDVFPTMPLIDHTLLDEILEPKLFELHRRTQWQARSRAATPKPEDWKCLHQRKSGWIPLDDPRQVYKAMVPGKTRVDDEHPPLRVKAVNVNKGVINQDEREPWTNTLDRPYRWICKLQIYYEEPDGDWSYGEGSGVLIGNRHVLTVAHHLYNKHFYQARAAVVIPGLNGIHNDPAKAMPFGWSWGNAFRTTTETRKNYCQHGEIPYGNDFAVVKLVDDLGNRSYPVLNGAPFGHWGHKSLGSHTLMQFKKSSSIRGVRVNVLGYPADRCHDSPVGRAITQDELDDCSSSDWASVPWLSFDRIVDPGSDNAQFTNMLVNHDFAPGISGSPVWIRWKGFRNLLGLAKATGGRSSIVVRFTKAALNEISSWIA